MTLEERAARHRNKIFVNTGKDEFVTAAHCGDRQA
jgi:hypothetical protein